MAGSGSTALVVADGTSQPLVASATAAATAATTAAATATAAASVAGGEAFREAAHNAALAAVVPPLPDGASALSASARVALVATYLLEPAGNVYGFVFAADVAGASSLANSASLMRVVRKLMDSETFGKENQDATWMRALGGSLLLKDARNTHWAGELHFEERATAERSQPRVITFRARESNKQMSRPFLGVQYAQSAQLALRLTQLHASGLITMSPRAALTLVETARDTIVPRPPPAPVPQPPLAHASGGLASIAQTAVQTFETLPGSTTHPLLLRVKERLETVEGREHHALVQATANWLRGGAGPELTDERVAGWARGIFVQESAAKIVKNPRLDLDAPRSAVPRPSPPAAPSPLQPSPVISEAGATHAAPRAAKRPREISAEEVAGMGAVELAALNSELLQLLQLVSAEGIKRAAASPRSPARSPLRESNAQRDYDDE